jgi:hypothetical protein
LFENHSLDPLHTTLAIGPLAVYLLLLGILNMSRRPFITTGTRDLYVLGLGLSGFFVIGPLALFMPERAARVFGGYGIWILLLIFYSLCLTLCVLLARPRLVIYNITLEQLRPLLNNLINRLELEHHWAGESLSLPGLGVQLQLERSPLTRNVSLVATAAAQSFGGWRRLELELVEELRTIEVKPSPIGLLMVLFSSAALVGSLGWIVAQRDVVAQGLQEMFRLF